MKLFLLDRGELLQAMVSWAQRRRAHDYGLVLTMRARIRSLLTSIALLVAPFVHAQSAWDALDDFSLKSNPAGVWSYSSVTTAGNVELLPNPLSDCPYICVSKGLSCWRDERGTMVGMNSTRHSLILMPYLDIACYPFVEGLLPPRLLILHSGIEGAKVTWTAPALGTYRLTGAFHLLDRLSQPGDIVTVSRNNALLRKKELNDFGDSMHFDVTRTLSAGETFEFAVLPAGSGHWIGLKGSVILQP